MISPHHPPRLRPGWVVFFTPSMSEPCWFQVGGKEITMIYLSNAFSLGMVPSECDVAIREAYEPARIATRAKSLVGHADTAALFSALLGVEIPFNRASVTLQAGDQILVGQYAGPRLPEGSTTLPQGATIRWLFVTIQAVDPYEG